jgi:hypothetical protein
MAAYGNFKRLVECLMGRPPAEVKTYLDERLAIPRASMKCAVTASLLDRGPQMERVANELACSLGFTSAIDRVTIVTVERMVELVAALQPNLTRERVRAINEVFGSRTTITDWNARSTTTWVGTLLKHTYLTTIRAIQGHARAVTGYQVVFHDPLTRTDMDGEVVAPLYTKTLKMQRLHH